MRANPGTHAENILGATFMMASVVAFVGNDTLMKTLSGEVPLFQAVLVRGALASLLIGGVAMARGEARLAALSVKDRRTAALRSLAEVGSTVCFLTALFAMPIANATAIMLAAPMLITLLGAVLLGERVGWRRWSAMIVGFLGVLLIVRPGGDAFNAASLWAVSAVVFVCVRDLATRRLSPETPSLLISLMTAVVITAAAGVVVVVDGWTPMGGSEVTRLAIAAVFVFVGYVFSVKAMRVGDVGFTSPFRYTILIWALILGWAVFGDAPEPLTLVGAGLVAGAGVYTFLRAGKKLR